MTAKAAQREKIVFNCWQHAAAGPLDTRAESPGAEVTKQNGDARLPKRQRRGMFIAREIPTDSKPQRGGMSHWVNIRPAQINTLGRIGACLCRSYGAWLFFGLTFL